MRKMDEKFEDVLKEEQIICGTVGGTVEWKDEHPEYQDDSPDVPQMELPLNHAERITITESNKEIIENWFIHAKSKHMEDYVDLVSFLKELMTKYNHDYGTIIEAMTAGAIATIHVMNEDKFQGGITGFQARCIMWEFIKRFNCLDGPMRLLQFEKMLYPQYEYVFEKFISKDTWEWLQKEAKERIFCNNGAHSDVIAHWQYIADGNIPFGYIVKEDE